ncbi:hypothetical protein [Thermomonas fusca]|uniref:Uncharacterized protein n=1 Tax=Thermomonas fusca TaxID=215690 RepID=A0A5R9PHL7_9GAMM|nr:hypothetical protein [Thermomonas fusca]TLX22238.1 hypothetical protein E5S66_06935 [Thermomonas fusca]
MPRPRKATESQPQQPLPATKTSHLFQGRKPAERGGALTRERIAEHMDAFRKAGGTIEVLGTTRSLQHIGLPADAQPAPPVVPVAARSRKSTR